MLLLLCSFPKKEVNACIITWVNYVSLFSRLPLALSLSNIDIYLYFFTYFQATRITIVIIPLSSCYYLGLRSIIMSYLRTSIFTNESSIGCLDIIECE